MRTAHNSSRTGGVSTRHPPDQAPPRTRHSPRTRHPPGPDPPGPGPLGIRHPLLGPDPPRDQALPWDQAPPQDQAPPWDQTPWDQAPPVNRITDTCKNITFPQLRLRAVKMRWSLSKMKIGACLRRICRKRWVLQAGRPFGGRCLHHL